MHGMFNSSTPPQTYLSMWALSSFCLLLVAHPSVQKFVWLLCPTVVLRVFRLFQPKDFLLFNRNAKLEFPIHSLQREICKQWRIKFREHHKHFSIKGRVKPKLKFLPFTTTLHPFSPIYTTMLMEWKFLIYITWREKNPLNSNTMETYGSHVLKC